MPPAFVSIHPYFKVHPGHLDAARALLPRFVARTSTEAKVLWYDFTIHEDVVHCREAYADAEAAQAHLANVGDLLAEMLQHSELVRLEFHGPEAEIAKLRGPLSHLNPQWYIRADGLQRP